MASPILPGSGLGSGLDTTAIVKALVDADKAAKQGQINRATKTNTASISGTGTLKSLLATFQAAMRTLGNTTEPQFTGYAASSSDTKVLSVTANNAAVNGIYKIHVDKLATGSKVATAAFSGGSTAPVNGGAAGVMTISQGVPGSATPKTFELNIPAGSTLESVAKSINDQFQFSGLSANIVTDNFGSRLVVSSANTGAGSDLSLSGIAGLEVDGTQVIPATSTAASAGAIGAVAQDAEFTVDGLPVTSPTNKLEKTVSGLSMTLQATGDSQVLVTTNTDGLKTSIQKFVDSYNAVVNAITSLTKPSLDDEGNPTIPAAFTGDAMPRSIMMAMRGPLAEVGNGGNLTVLSQLGIATDQKTGALVFDSAKFSTAMNDKKLGGDVQTLFTGDDGLLSRMSKALSAYTETGGILDTRTTQLNKNKNKLSEEQLALDRRVETLTSVLTKKYNDMDKLVGALEATQKNIKSMFDAMAAQQKNS